jgi:hypothetical protein
VGTSGSADERLRGRHGQRPQLAGLDVRQHRRHGVEGHRDLAAEQVGHQRAAALVGDVPKLAPVMVLELRADQVLRGAVAVGAVVELPGLALASATSSATFLAGIGGIDHQHVGHHRDGGDRRRSFWKS